MKQVFARKLDFKNLIAACLSYLLWQFSMSTPTQPIFVPDNDPSVLYPAVQSEIFPRKTLEYTIFYGFGIFFALVAALSKLFPKFIKKFNFFTLLWAEITCISTASIITCLAKSYVGWPRPTMRTKCGENANYTTCNLKSPKRDKEFISWPSAHATEAASAGLFLALFVDAVLVDDSLFKSMLSAILFIGFAVFVGGSRIRDFKHHPDDVTSGLLIGFLVTYYIWSSVKAKIFDVQPDPSPFTPDESGMQDIDPSMDS